MILGYFSKFSNHDNPFIKIEDISIHTPPFYSIIVSLIKSATDCLNGSFELSFIFVKI